MDHVAFKQQASKISTPPHKAMNRLVDSLSFRDCPGYRWWYITIGFACVSECPRSLFDRI